MSSEQNRNQEDQKNNPTEPPVGSGSQRYDFLLYGTTLVVGLMLGAGLTQGIASVVIDHTSLSNLPEIQKKLIVDLSLIPGAAICGFVIPTELYRRAHNLSWSDIRDRIFN